MPSIPLSPIINFEELGLVIKGHGKPSFKITGIRSRKFKGFFGIDAFIIELI